MKTILLSLLLISTLSCTSTPVSELSTQSESASRAIEKPSHFYWNQPQTTVAQAQAFEYWLYLDGLPIGSSECEAGINTNCAIQLTPVECIDTKHIDGPECNAPVPAISPGNHKAKLTAYDGMNESVLSMEVDFSMKVTIAPPTNFRATPTP